MEQIIVLGTGHAVVKKCYNTCFALKYQNEYMLIDAGGGNTILTHLEKAQIPLSQIHHLFVTHAHTDHILGVVWMIRMIGSLILTRRYQKTFHIYCHEELVETIKTLCQLTLQKNLIDLFDNQHICFHPLKDGDQIEILQHPFTFFDIHSTKTKQFGFTFINTNQEKIAFTGDEPYNQECLTYVKGAQWLLHEAFCLFSEKDIYKPYEKHHSTAKDAAKLASSLNVQNLVLWHTEEDHLNNRKALYTHEASQYFNSHIYVPNDLETISLL